MVSSGTRDAGGREQKDRSSAAPGGRTALALLDLGRGVCGDLAVAERREWLVTNGIGGYAAGTIAGVLTHRYHGLLIAALAPPLGRTLLLTKLDETATYAVHDYPLGANRWASGVVDPTASAFWSASTSRGRRRCGPSPVRMPCWRSGC
jgi:hypothetical protein